MSKDQFGQALLKVAGDASLTEAFALSPSLECKVSFLKEQGFDVDASDFEGLAQVVVEAKAMQEFGDLSDQELSAAQGGFFGDVLGAGIGIAVGTYFGAQAGAAIGGGLGFALGTMIDAVVGSVLGSEKYNKLNDIVSVEGVVKGMATYDSIVK